MFWKRKPVTHAAALWVIIVLGAAGLATVWAYFADLTHPQPVTTAPAHPGGPAPAAAPQQPTLFGTVKAVAGSTLTIDSKQPFTQITLQAGTAVTSVGGAARAISDLSVGDVITATGKDLGGGKLEAAAIVILQDH